MHKYKGVKYLKKFDIILLSISFFRRGQMLKFKDYEYKRPDMEKVEEEIMYLIEEFEKANSSKEQNEIIGKINGIREEVESMSNLVYIRHSINTLDEYYDKEHELLDEIMPL